MKALLAVSLTLIASAFAFSFSHAGPISSGGTNQTLENCETNNHDMVLKVQVENNDHLEAELVEYASVNSTPVVRSTVHRVANGYDGKTIKIHMEYVQGVKIATVVVLSDDPRIDPLVYSNLICSEFIR